MPTGKFYGFNFYGRRRGKKISGLKKRLIEDFLPSVSVSGIGYKENPNREYISFFKIFGSHCPVWIEVGFGGGEHLLSIAQGNTNVGFIGCEPYLNGMAMFLSKLHNSKLSNVRVIMDDARILFDVTPTSSISKLFLLFPDPWPKRRHADRRFINKNNIKVLKRIIRSGGILHIATDVDMYVKHVLETFLDENEFEWLAERPKDWKLPWPGWKSTRYEEKAINSGKRVTYLTFRRL